MLNGFEKETAQLNDYERNTLLPIVVAGLRSKVGKSKAIANAKICAKMRAAGYVLTEPRLRKIINYIRLNGLVECLIATSDGYYIATSEQELLEYAESLLSREQAIAAIRQAIQQQRNKRFSAQQQSLNF